MQMKVLQLRLLGEFQAVIGDLPIENFPTDKIRALLAYLAAEADRLHARTHLATLLWSEWDEAAARANLRKSLFRLRKTLGETAESLLTITRSSVQLHSETAVIDVLRFEQLSQKDDIDSLTQAADLYKGDLLVGLTLADAPAFDDWLTVRREQLHQQALTLFHQLSELYMARQAFGLAEKYAARQVALEPWHEPAHQQLMRAYAAAGQRAQALVQYEQCIAVLNAEMGMAPTIETQQLADAIRGEAAPGIRLHHFPPPHTSFIGREADVERVIARLHNPQTRLITITGTGGVGKTRLAIEAVTRSLVHVGIQDAYFVPLSSVVTQDGIWQTLGTQLGVQPEASGLLPAAVIDFVRDCAPLLILDNYEQLAPDTACIEELLRVVPDVRLLVTSRVPLNLRAEWRLPLEGLMVPAATAVDIASYPSVALLLTAGRQVQPDLLLSVENEADIGRICRALAGMPLALEMAGSWLGLFSPRLLADQIEQGLDFLVAARRDMPARHRSLRAIFDHAQQQLQPAERKLLGQLASFHDSFTLPAVLNITAATLPAINKLVDHALVQRQANDRYSLHPVLLSFLQEDKADVSDLLQKHAYYYLQQVAAMGFKTIAQLVDDISYDIANVRAAWQWAAAQRNDELLATALDGLLTYYEFRGTYDEGCTQFATAAQLLPISGLHNRLCLAEAACALKLGDFGTTKVVVEAVLATGIAETRLAALIMLGRLYERRTEYDTAVAVLQEALTLAESQSKDAARIWNILGQIYAYRGPMEKRIAAHQHALAISSALGDELQTAECFATLSEIYKDTGAYDEAMAHIKQALTIVERLDHRANIGLYTQKLGTLYWRQERLAEAQTCYEKALAIVQELNHKRSIMICTGSLGILAKRRRDYDQALDCYRRAVQLANQLGDKASQAVYLGNIGNVYMDIGPYTRALDYYQRAIALDRAAGALGGVGRHLGNIGDMLKFQQRYAEALPYFEEAIPYLRQGALHYFLCWVLVSYAECLFEVGRFEEAGTVNAEGGQLAAEMDREFYYSSSLILNARMLAENGDMETAVAQLNALRPQTTYPEILAEIDFFLWQIGADPASRAAAADGFAHLYQETRRVRYRERLASVQ